MAGEFKLGESGRNVAPVNKTGETKGIKRPVWSTESLKSSSLKKTHNPGGVLGETQTMI